MPKPVVILAATERFDARMTHGIRIGGQPFFPSVIFSSKAGNLPISCQHFRMLYKNFTRVNI